MHLDFLADLIGRYGIYAVFLLVMIEGDLTLLLAGVLAHEAFFGDAEKIFRRHQGRPHWAKLHSLGRRELAELYPEWDRFQAVRKRLDPDGRFLNEHLRRLFV